MCGPPPGAMHEEQAKAARLSGAAQLQGDPTPPLADAATNDSGRKTTLLRVGGEEVQIDVPFLEALEPDCMLLPLLSERWAGGGQDDSTAGGNPSLELGGVIGVEPEAVLVLLRGYAATGVVELHLSTQIEAEEEPDANQLRSWSADRVRHWVESVAECERIGELFQQHKIDGSKLMMLCGPHTTHQVMNDWLREIGVNRALTFLVVSCLSSHVPDNARLVVGRQLLGPAVS